MDKFNEEVHFLPTIEFEMPKRSMMESDVGILEKFRASVGRGSSSQWGFLRVKQPATYEPH
jgi:hypothetical protein